MKNQELSIEEIHAGTLEILKKVIEICKMNGIDYFITYGSLIGAVRHKGFIPWDDDLDIAMFRDDFDAFCTFCHVHEKELFPFKLLDKTNTKNYPYNLPRMCDMRYRLISDLIPDVEMGMFVDIYPFDGLGDDPEYAKKKLELRMSIYTMAIDFKNRNKFVPSQNGLISTLKRRCVYIWSIIHSREYIYSRMENLKYIFPDVAHSEYVGCIVWDGYVIPKKKEWCDKTIKALFENIEVDIPVGYDEMLKASYGDYLKLPPLNERKSTHNYKLFRLT